jgi:hypothetical protein
MNVSGKPDRVNALLDEAERQPFVGWDFSWLRGRLDSQPLPWDYTATVVEHARNSSDLLDLGTGGGEWLAELSYRPPRTVATEAWGPNLVTTLESRWKAPLRRFPSLRRRSIWS